MASQPYPEVIQVSRARRAGEAPRRLDHRLDELVEVAPLVRLAVVEGDALGALVDAHQGEPKLRLARIALGVEADQRPTDEQGQAGPEPGIGDGDPDHVAGNLTSRPNRVKLTFEDRNQRTPMKLTRRRKALSMPTPSSVVSSENRRQSSCRRWSGWVAGLADEARAGRPGWA